MHSGRTPLITAGVLLGLGAVLSVLPLPWALPMSATPLNEALVFLLGFSGWSASRSSPWGPCCSGW